MRRNLIRGIGCFFLLFAVGMDIWFLGFDLPRLNAARGSGGGDAVGHITATKVLELEHGENYKATFVFTDARGGEHQIENTYPKPYWDTLQVGSEVHVRYLAADPSYAFDVESYFAKKNGATMLLICSCVAAFGLALMFLSRFARR